MLHLLVAQRRADLQAILLGEGGAGGQQGLVLGFVVGVVADEALARGGDDLVGDQFLFVEAVTQALERVGVLQIGVGARLSSLEVKFARNSWRSAQTRRGSSTN
uniref:hypothetical protein n=1 Tax=Bordetella sputigena TaxID=1416810 RepID=UPI0039EFBB6E